MSRAFVKEDAAQPDEDPPERPLSPHPNYCTPRGVKLLQDEEERLLAALGPLRGTQADPAKRKAKRTIERNLRYVRARLESAIPVDPAGQPRGEVRFGATVVLEGRDGARRTIRIVGEDEAEGGDELLPWPAPLAQVLLGLAPGAGFDWDGADGREHWTVASVSY